MQPYLLGAAFTIALVWTLLCGFFGLMVLAGASMSDSPSASDEAMGDAKLCGAGFIAGIVALIFLWSWISH